MRCFCSLLLPAQVVLDHFALKVEEGLAPSTLPSFLAALAFFEEAGELPEDRKFAARWRSGPSTAIRQLLAARHAQKAAAKGPDFHGEEQILRDLKAHLAREQVPAPLIEWMLEVLTLPNFSLRPTPLVDIQLALADAPEPYQPTEPAESDVDNIVWDGIPTPVEQGDEIPLNQVGIAEAVAAQASEPEPVGYVISLTKRGRCRR